MKKIFLFTFTCIFAFAYTYSQHKFVVQNTQASVFNTLQEAYDNAVPGDTIYIPGGSFNFPASVDKSLVWIGVGYHPDSSSATYYSRINNAVLFTGNSDNSYVTGFHFIGNVSIGSTGNDAENFTFVRNRVNGSLYLKYNDGKERPINSRVSECIIDGNISANYGSDITVEKTIVRGVADLFRGSLFDRILFTYGLRSLGSGVSYAFTNTVNCQIRNSVINYYYYNNWKADFASSMNNNFINNIFAGNITFPDGTNTGSDNLTGIDLSTVFEHIEGNLQDFSYLHDFHLKEGSPAIGTGTLGTDIGLFGGSSPFKEGGLPGNPHIRSINIGLETTNGLLPVEIEAVSQDN